MDCDNQQSMEEIQMRILRVTDDLRIIQSELNCAAMQAPTDPELLEVLSGPAQMESLNVLKSVLDQMRHFLWFYMQVVTSDPRARPMPSCSAISPIADSASRISDRDRKKITAVSRA